MRRFGREMQGNYIRDVGRFATFLGFLPEAVTSELSWPGLTGRISKQLFELVLNDVTERVVMCCGPAPFMAAAKQICLELGVLPTNFIEKSFDAAVVVDAPQPLAGEVETHAFSVEFARQNRSIDVAAEQTVLAAARKAGMRLPASCANGLCGTCKSKLVRGSVDMKHSGGIRQREIDAGFFLPCCSKPLSDLVIDR